MRNYRNQVVSRLKKWWNEEHDVKALQEIGKRYEYGFHYESDEYLEQDLEKAYKCYLQVCWLNDNNYIPLAEKILNAPKYFKQDANLACDLLVASGSHLTNGNPASIFLARANILGFYEEINIVESSNLLIHTKIVLNKIDANKYNYYLDSGDVYYYGLRDGVDFKHAYLNYLYALRIIIKEFNDKIVVPGLYKTNPNSYRRILDLSSDLFDKYIKNDVPFCGFYTKQIRINKLSVTECVEKNSKESLYRAAFAYRYGFGGVSQDYDLAIKYYKKAFTKQNFNAGYELINLCENLTDKIKYYRRTIAFIVDRLLKILSKGYGCSENDWDFRSLKSQADSYRR